MSLIQEIEDAAEEINPDIMVLCRGGPIGALDDSKYVLSKTKGVQGFYEVSSMERLLVEKAFTETTKTFKDLSLSA